jgi:hypothetical protein
MSSQWFWPPKHYIFVSNGSIWWGEFDLGIFIYLFFTLKGPKKSKFEIRKKLVSRLILGFRPVFCAFGARVFF